MEARDTAMTQSAIHALPSTQLVDLDKSLINMRERSTLRQGNTANGLSIALGEHTDGQVFPGTQHTSQHLIKQMLAR